MLSGMIEELPWESLLSVARAFGSDHVSLFGSVLRKPLAEVADVDLHLVVPRLDRSAFGALAAAAEATAKELAARAGRPWRVELRHGPFKPAPGAARELQLHLLLDDHASLARSPCALLAQRSATGRLLAGEPLLGRRGDCGSPATWVREARVELARWRDALAAGEIPFRHWVLEPEPGLVDGRTAAATDWDLECLLRGAATSADLHYRAAVLAAQSAEEAAEELALPLRSKLLSGSWERRRDQAIAVLERRLDHLSRL